jgi:hypothetical protein
MVLYLCVLIVFSLHRELFKLILVDEPLTEVVLSYSAILLPSVLWHNWQTITSLVLRPKPRNYRGDFMAEITKLQLPVLRPKPGNLKPPILRPNQEKLSTLVLKPNQETRAPLLLVHDADHTRHHPTSRSSGHWVPDLCLTIPSPLH